MKTIWKTIPGFSLYQASNTGKIRSMNYKKSGKVKILHPCLSGGYLKTMLLSDSGKYKTWSVHKWIASTYLGECCGKEVNHKNGIKVDNSANNLEYVTRSENLTHAYSHGLLTPQRGSANGNSKLKKEDVLKIIETAKSGGRYYGRKLLAAKYCISESHVKDIVSGRRDVWRKELGLMR